MSEWDDAMEGWNEDETECAGCGTSGDYYDGLCYACQCDAHANGSYDMDAED